MRIASGVIDQYAYVDMGQVGLTTFTVYRARNGAAAVQMTTPTIAEVDATNMPNLYSLLLDEDMTIGAGNFEEAMIFSISHIGVPTKSIIVTLFDPFEALDQWGVINLDGKEAIRIEMDANSTQLGKLGTPSVDISADIATRMAEASINTTAGAVDTVTSNTDMRGTDGANVTAPDNSGIAAVKAKTDQLTFTKANEVDSNGKSWNGATIVGDGSIGDKIRTENA